MTDIEVRQIAVTDKEYKEAYILREELLRKPLGLSLDDEDLSGEVNDTILVAKQEGAVIGCLILTPIQEGTLQLRQMAVCDKVQGKGVGRVLVNAAEQKAVDMGYNTIILHARLVAEGFYNRLGYKKTSDVFTEVSIPHVVMEKTDLETL